jgi:hypothetical protein
MNGRGPARHPALRDESRPEPEIPRPARRTDENSQARRGTGLAFDQTCGTTPPAAGRTPKERL